VAWDALVGDGPVVRFDDLNERKLETLKSEMNTHYGCSIYQE